MKLRLTSDQGTIEALNTEIFPSDPLKGELQQCWWWVLTADGRLPVGFCGMRLARSYEGIYFLIRAGVLPKHRGAGIQRRMIRARCSMAKKLGAYGVLTYTLIDNPASANNLIRCGFWAYRPEDPWAGQNVNYWFKYL